MNTNNIKLTTEGDFRQVAEDLWQLLDDIDSMGDVIKPNNYESFQRYFMFTQKMLKRRFRYFKPGGDTLHTKDEWAKYLDRMIGELTR